MFVEIEDHQINLEMLQTNQSAGSFLDEISKWQSTLQHIEGLLHQWKFVQQLWIRLDYLHELISFDQQTSQIFFKVDRDFRALMISVKSNPNVLKCCQKKSESKRFLFSFFSASNRIELNRRRSSFDVEIFSNSIDQM